MRHDLSEYTIKPEPRHGAPNAVIESRNKYIAMSWSCFCFFTVPWGVYWH